MTGRVQHSPFARWLDGYMAGHRLTNREVAEQLGAAPETVRKWRKMGTSPPVEMVVPLARALGVHPMTLLEAASPGYAGMTHKGPPVVVSIQNGRAGEQVVYASETVRVVVD